jgi:hypothetical protein
MSKLRRINVRFRIQYTKVMNELCKSPSNVEIKRSKELGGREIAAGMAKESTS